MKIKVSDYIAKWIAEKGIRHVFTVTGGGAMHLNDSFGSHPQLASIYNHHEQACAMAAEGYYKACGVLPLVCVTTGPGGTNALTGVLGAWLDSVPMFVISGQVKFECTVRSVPELGLRQLGDQEFDIAEAVKSMTKYSVMVTEPNRIKYHLEKAHFLAINDRPGPVWLDLPLDLQAAVIDTQDLLEYDSADDDLKQNPIIDIEQIQEVLRRIEKAKSPAIIVGAGIRLSGAFPLLADFVKQLNIPIMTAWNSNDLVEDSNPLYAGRPGTVGTRGGNFVFQNTDLLLVLGCRMNLRQVGYAKSELAPKAFKIMVDIDQAELKKETFKVDMQIHGNCLHFIQNVLNSGYRKSGADNERWISWCQEINLKYSAIRDITRRAGQLNPYVFIDRMYKVMPESLTTVTSNGSACVIAFQAATVKKNQRLFTNSGCASMGYGLPASIGACVALEKANVVCLEGDGSLQMNIQELQTIVQNKLPIKLFVINNNGYLSIKQTQANFFKGRFAGIDSDSGLSFPDLSKIAFAYGLQFFKIDNEDAIESTLDKIMSSPVPVLCEVKVDPDQIFAPKSSSKLHPDGKMTSAPLHDMFPFLSEDEMKSNIFK